jgi:hypothetical protein
MENLLPINWYIETPIDFEHKQYTLLAYLQKVDHSFLLKNLSPHLLHMETMVKELYLFNDSFTDIKKKFDKERYIFFKDNSKLIGEDNHLVYEIKEIVEFSIPQVECRIMTGNKILEKNRQVLY